MDKTLFKILALALLMAFTACKSEGGNADPNNSDTPDSQVRPASFDNDDALLDYIERIHFNYMWDGAEPTSGLARERIHLDGDYPEHDQDVVTTGGSGFGRTVENLQPSVGYAITIIEGKILNNNPSSEQLKQWVVTLF